MSIPENDRSICSALLFGPPGSGKTTIGRHLAIQNQLSVLHVGETIRDIAGRGGLSPGDECDLRLGKPVSCRVLSQAFKVLNPGLSPLLIEGPPRSVEQAEYLRDRFIVEFVFHLTIGDESLIERIAERFSVERRADDHISVARDRVQTFRAVEHEMRKVFSSSIVVELDANNHPLVTSNAIARYLRL